MDGGDSAGGSGELARLIDEHGESIVSDLSTYHGIKPWQILDGTYPPRVLLAYIAKLPIDSATAASLRGGDQFRGWDVNTYVLANIFDAVQSNTYAFIAANSKKKPPKPEPMPRPSNKKAKKKDPANNKFAAMARLAFKKGREQ